MQTIIKNTIKASRHFDVAVIGAGAGLPKIARPSAELGLKVAFFENDRLGGTCLNRGCIPSKMLIHPADIITQMEDAHRFNIHLKGYSVDFEGLVNRVTNIIDEESFSINPRIENLPNLTWYKHDYAKFISEKHIQVGNDVISADRIFIAAGCRPKIPKIPGLEQTPFMTSTEALRLTKQPKQLIIIGGGYIAVELAHYFASLGSEVTMIVRGGLIRHEDEEIRKEFTKVFTSRKNIRVLLNTQPLNAKYEKEFLLNCKDENGNVFPVKGDALLLATGVVPNSDRLQVDQAGIQTNQEGFIQVDDYLQTSSPNVWAFGDIIGRYLFRHNANFEGEYLLETVIHNEPKYPIDYTGMPHAIFSHPQIAGVGDTEEELIKKGIKYVKGVNYYKNSAMGMALDSQFGFVKLLIEKKTRKILGCHIIGEQASVLIHEVIPLMRLGGKLDDLLYMIHIHPALSELVRNAARKARDALIAEGEDIPIKLRVK